MLGFIASIFTLILSFINAIKSMLEYIPIAFGFAYDLADFVSDMYSVFFSELNSPIIVLSYIFLQLVVVRLIIQLL